MGSKQWMAVVQLVTGPIVLAWLAWNHLDGGIGDGGAASLSQALLWALAAIVVFNIVGMILVAIGVSIAQGEEWRDEAADERDEILDARASRIGYAVASILAVVTLIPIAMGADPLLALAMLFLAPLGGGLIHAAAVLVLYRVS